MSHRFQSMQVNIIPAPESSIGDHLQPLKLGAKAQVGTKNVPVVLTISHCRNRIINCNAPSPSYNLISPPVMGDHFRGGLLQKCFRSPVEHHCISATNILNESVPEAWLPNKQGRH